MSRLGHKKGVYHSALVTYTESNGPLPIVIKDTVKKSQNKDLLGMQYFHIVGEDGQFETPEHYYNIEHEGIKTQLATAPRGVVLLIEAHGHGTDKSTHSMTIRTAEGVKLPAPATQAAAPQRATAAPTEPGEAQPAAPPPDHRPPTLMRQAADCYMAAGEIVGGLLNAFPFLKDASPDTCLEVVGRLANSMGMDMDRHAGLRPLRASKPGKARWVLLDEAEG